MRFAALVSWPVSLLAYFLFRYSPWTCCSILFRHSFKAFWKKILDVDSIWKDEARGSYLHYHRTGLHFQLIPIYAPASPQTAMPHKSFHLGLSFLNFAGGTEKCAPSLCRVLPHIAFPHIAFPLTSICGGILVPASVSLNLSVTHTFSPHIFSWKLLVKCLI